MSDKSSGIDFDRQVFVQPQGPIAARPAAARVTGVAFALAVIAAVVFLGYKVLPQVARDSASAGDPALVNLDKRLGAIEGRLERLEANRRASVAATKEEPADPKKTQSNTANTAARTVYQISPAPREQVHRAPAAAAPKPDPATVQRLSALQQGLGALQNDAAGNREAWQATTDKLADVAGQVGTQNVLILRNQDEVNLLLARSQRTAIPFELHRGSDSQQIGPVNLGLKSTNQKSQRYTLCVYVQQSCLELKDKALFEVTEFVVTRDSAPLVVIATKISKDGILGFLEVPQEKIRH
jgi:hypothetical protein